MLESCLVMQSQVDFFSSCFCLFVLKDKKNSFLRILVNISPKTSIIPSITMYLCNDIYGGKNRQNVYGINESIKF